MTFKGHGDGTFGNAGQAVFGQIPGARLTVDDLDRDGNDDIVLVRYPPSFQPDHPPQQQGMERLRTELRWRGATSSISGDLNGDGIDDTALVINGSLAVVRGLRIALQYAAPVVLDKSGFNSYVLAADVRRRWRRRSDHGRPGRLDSSSLRLGRWDVSERHHRLGRNARSDPARSSREDGRKGPLVTTIGDTSGDGDVAGPDL